MLNFICATWQHTPRAYLDAEPPRLQSYTHDERFYKTIKKMVRPPRCKKQTLEILRSMRVVMKKGKRTWRQADGGIQEKNSRLFYDIIQVLEALGLVTRNKRPAHKYMRREKDCYHLSVKILPFIGALNESFSVEKATNEFLEVEKAKIQSQKLELELLSAPLLVDMDMDTDKKDVVDCFDPAKNLFD